MSQPTEVTYTAVAAELHRIADALAAMSVAGLADLHVRLDISPALHERNAQVDPLKVATVDAVALAVLGRAAAAEETFTNTDWIYHKAEKIGPVGIRVFALVEDPGVREQKSEIERLRAELAEAKRQLAATPGGGAV